MVNKTIDEHVKALEDKRKVLLEELEVTYEGKETVSSTCFGLLRSLIKDYDQQILVKVIIYCS